MGFRAIGRVLGVSNVTISTWIPAFGEAAERERKPGGPQTALGLRVCEMGLYEGAGLSADLRCADLPVLEVRASVIRFGGAATIQQGDSGGVIERAATGTPVCVLSNFQPGDRTRQYCEPWPGEWMRGVRAAWD